MRDREQNITPQQKMLREIKDFIVETNKDMLSPAMISKALRRVDVSVSSKTIKSFLLSIEQEPYKNVKNQAQKVAKKEVANEAKNKIEDVKENLASNGPQNIDGKEVINEDVNEPQESDNEIEK